jgi:hypothetical protein
MKRHRSRAERDPSFLQGLLKTYNDYPLCWSLQELLQPVLCRPLSNPNELRRSQVRAYILVCNQHLLLYSQYEVRLPRWKIDLDNLLAEESVVYSRDDWEGPRDVQWSEEVERDCVGAGNARPYNEERDKSSTERYLIEELDELIPAKEAINICMKETFSAMKAHVFSNNNSSTITLDSNNSIDMNNKKASLAILGVDLIVSKQSTGYVAQIVEVNNNPAMPQENKQMSINYRNHHINMIRSFAALY